jgi:phosphatidylglycerol:prolipoprotein diacylglycerol transferase
VIPEIISFGPYKYHLFGDYGPSFAIHSFGLMLVLAFLASWRILAVILDEAGEDSEMAEKIIFWIALSGIVGARLVFLITYSQEFWIDPVSAIFSGAGFVYYGGFIGSALWLTFYLKKNGKDVLAYADYLAPALAVGYAVGRIGCHLSGDGDYGVATDLPWGFSYHLGVVPTPEGVLVHPTPIYETIASLALAYLLLWLLRSKKMKAKGEVFGVYLILSSVLRFLVEFVRIEPKDFYGFSQAQVVSIAVIVLGLGFVLRATFLNRRLQ